MQSLAAHRLFEGLARHDEQSNKDSFASMGVLQQMEGLQWQKKMV